MAKKDTKTKGKKKAPAKSKATPKKGVKKPAKKASAKPKAASKAKTAATPQPDAVADAAPFSIHAQYVRDLSFENPDALQSLRPGQPAPQMDINIGMDARKVPDMGIDNFFEVALNIRAEAKRNGNVVFMVELQYGVAVSIEKSVPEDTHHPLLLIEIPRLAFPYARQILADASVQGGYPPLLLNPVDFHSLYMQQFGDQIKQNHKKAG